MKYWNIEEPKQLSVVEVEDTISTEEMAKVKILKSTLSYYEYSAFSGTNKSVKYPFSFGRHAIGIVTECKDDVEIKKGDRVYIEPYIKCGECQNCKKGIDPCLNIKIRGVDEKGLIADFVRVPYDNLVKLPDNIDDEEATLLNYVSIADQVFDLLELQPSSNILIYGTSLESLVIAQFAMYLQMMPIVICDKPKAKDFFVEQGIYYSFFDGDPNLNELLNDTLCGKKADALVYCGTTTEGFRKTLDYVANLGQVVYVPIMKSDVSINLKSIIDKHLSIKINYPRFSKKNCIKAINMVVNKHIKLSGVFGKRVSINDLENELKDDKEYFDNPSLKTIINF